MDKNTITGFSLIALILIGYSFWSRPSAEEQRQAFVADSIAEVNKIKAERAAAEAKAAEQSTKTQIDTTALFFHAMSGKEEKVVLKNEKVELTINSKGGTVEQAVIKNFADREGAPDVTLFDGKSQKLSFVLGAKQENIEMGNLYFDVSDATDSTVVLTARDGDRALNLSYRLGADYLLHLDMSCSGLSGLFAANDARMEVLWKDVCRQQEKGFTFENRYATLTWHKAGGGTDYLNETREKRDEPIEDETDWIAFKNQFFSAVMITGENFKAGGLVTSIPQEKGSGYLKEYEARLVRSFNAADGELTQFEFYYGPNDFRLLQRVEEESTFGKNLELERLVWLGWPLFRIINRWFTLYVFDGLTSLGLNMGIVLILITLLLKLITFPLVKKSYMSSAKMRVLKPKLDAATAQYDKPEDQMQKQQAMMQEYAKYGVSPLSGCLPMLIQLPIWIAMFNFVPNAIQLRGESFLWIDDLSTYDPIIEWGQNLWLIGDHLSLTCILFCVANLLYSFMTMRQQKDQMVGQQAEQMKTMQWMMMLMPLMFFFMFNDYSSGLNFYYFVSLFFSAAIMWTLRKTTNDKKLLETLERRYEENKNNPKKAGGLAARLQAMQEQQMEMQRRREELERKKHQK